MLFTQIKQKIPVNLVIGSLGSGKTSLLKHLLQHQAKGENWGILLNEFGAIGIDSAILDSDNNSIQISQIPGGCICCTALTDFKAAIEKLAEQHSLDRIFIEPTGLSEPDAMVELLHSTEFQQQFELQTIFAVLDSSNTKPEQFAQLLTMRNLVEVADVIVLNKQDMASAENIAALNEYAESLYPPKLAIVNTSQSIIDPAMISLQSLSQQSSQNNLISLHHQARQEISTSANHQETEPKSDPVFDWIKPPLKLKGIDTRKSQLQLNTLSIGWIFNNDVDFNWKKLLNLFKEFEQTPLSENSPLRAKGVFKLGKPRMLFQWVKQKNVTREYVAHKRDSRIEILLPQNHDFDIEQFELKLSQCQND